MQETAPTDIPAPPELTAPSAARRTPLETALALLALGVLLGIGMRALAPFLGALLWAGVLAVSSWKLADRLERRLGGRRALAAVLISCFHFVVLALPLIYFSVTLEEGVQSLWARATEIAVQGLPGPPAFLARIPGIGPRLTALWQHDQANLPSLVGESQGALVIAGQLALTQLSDLASAVGELVFGILLAGQILAAGRAVPDTLRQVAIGLGGPAGAAALDATARAVLVVGLGVIGGAVVEAVLTAIGFWLTGLPLAPLLALLCFVLRVLQIGAWPVWIAGVLWLWLWQGSHGAAIALVAWLAIVVLGSNRLLEPYLITRRSMLPRPLLFLAVLGGLLAWGFSGMFLGAAAVAVTWTLVHHWLDVRAPAAAA